MKAFNSSALLTFSILGGMFALASIAGYDVVEHMQTSSGAAKVYYITCSLVLWASSYFGFRAEIKWDELRRKWDLEDEEWQRRNSK